MRVHSIWLVCRGFAVVTDLVSFVVLCFVEDAELVISVVVDRFLFVWCFMRRMILQTCGPFFKVRASISLLGDSVFAVNCLEKIELQIVSLCT